MKKMFVMAAMATIMFAGCVKNEPASVPAVSGEQEIAFESPVIAPTVKSVNEIAGTVPTTSDFVVSAWYVQNPGSYTAWSDDALYIDNAPVDYDPTNLVWKPVDKYYWPKSGKLTFAAYSPKSDNGTYVFGNTGLTIQNYVVGDVDLLYSERAYDKTVTKTNGTVADPVILNFQHALSSIVFTVALKEDYDNVSLYLKKVSIKGINSKGNFDQGIAEATDLNVSNPKWTSSVPTDFVAFQYAGAGSGQQIVYSAENKPHFLGATQSTSNPAERKENTSDLFVIPQDIPTPATLEVVYVMDNGIKAITETVNVPISGHGEKWECGKRYTYNIKVALDEITFTTNVLPWVDGGSTESAF